MDDKTIRFIDSDYKELFRIPNGGSITITYPPSDGREPVTRACEFLDETHTKIGGNVYHICEFAERMEAIGARYEPEIQLRNAELVPFSAGEEKFFTYNHEEGNSCIGHIAGEFGQSGDRYFSNWSDRKNDRNTLEFQAELHSAVYALRQGLLKDYDSMLAYCQSHPEAKLDGGDKYSRYGFKLETDTRQYFVSCFFGESMRDARFIAYAYDKDAPVLEQAQTPGQDVIGENVHGYEIQQAVCFVNDRGFALAHNPAAPSPFVTWQFTEENGQRDYYWGHYLGDAGAAQRDLDKRVSEYRTEYGFKEKYSHLASAEMSREQNYNMIDGLHNNEPAPRADLTDGQTLEEIRELAPETLPDEKTSVLDRIRDARDPTPHKEKDAHTHARDKEDLSL